MKGNQKTLRSDLVTAFERVEEALRRGRGTIPPYWEREWREKGVVFGRYRESSVGHGRYEERELWALFDPEVNRKAGITGSVGEAWPHRSQIVRLTRKRTLKGETTTETG